MAKKGIKKLILKKGREKSVLRFHPWIFSSAIEMTEGESQLGETVAVLDHEGRFLAWAAYSPYSQIQARIWTWKEDEEINEKFFENRIISAAERRKKYVDEQKTNAYRLLYAESDGLPGVIVDRYGEIAVAQYLTAGAEYWREVIADLVMKLPDVDGIYERSDAEVRGLEGLTQRCGIQRGRVSQNIILVVENGSKFLVDIAEGHKTGFYLDQKENRQWVKKFADGKRVLDCFCYTGGFSVAALSGGAEFVHAVDSSASALALSEANIQLNHLDAAKIRLIERNVFTYLRELRDRGEKYDLIILDPPKFAPTNAQVQRASRGYKDINLLALKLLNDNGILVTFSCSGGVDSMLFQRIVASAALDAEIEATIMHRFGQALDHPVRLSFPEGEYLKGLAVQIIK